MFVLVYTNWDLRTNDHKFQRIREEEEKKRRSQGVGGRRRMAKFHSSLINFRLKIVAIGNQT